jgi:rRNA maturation protein Nop10
MPRGKIDLQKVLARLNTTCPKCGKVISPSEVRRINFEEMIFPECGERFKPARPALAK